MQSLLQAASVEVFQVNACCAAIYDMQHSDRTTLDPM